MYQQALIALYFACSKSSTMKIIMKLTGTSLFWRRPRSEIKFFDSDTVSCIANLSSSLSFSKAAWKLISPFRRLTNLKSADNYYTWSAMKSPISKSIIDPVHLSKIVVVKGRLSNARISSQSGAFLLFGENVDLPETGLSTLNIKKLVIRNEASDAATEPPCSINKHGVPRHWEGCYGNCKTIRWTNLIAL